MKKRRYHKMSGILRNMAFHNHYFFLLMSVMCVKEIQICSRIGTFIWIYNSYQYISTCYNNHGMTEDILYFGRSHVSHARAATLHHNTLLISIHSNPGLQTKKKTKDEPFSSQGPVSQFCPNSIRVKYSRVIALNSQTYFYLDCLISSLPKTHKNVPLHVSTAVISCLSIGATF